MTYIKGTPYTLSCFVLVVIAVSASQLHAQSFTYCNFNSTAGITMNGGAGPGAPIAPETETVLRFSSMATSAWYQRPVPVTNGFTVNYTFNINSCIGLGCADGLAFVLQNSAASTGALGGWGGNMGYSQRDSTPGIENSLAIEFDDYFNQELNDPSANHVAVQSCGTAPNQADHKLCNLSLTNKLGVQLSDGASHTVEIAYVPGNLYTSIDNRIVMTTPVDLSALLSLPDGNAYIGFTGGTGSGGQNSDILKWSYSSRFNAYGTLTSSSNPSALGEPITFTATLKAKYQGLSVPTGTVYFYDGATLLGTVDLVDGVATLTTSDLSAGSHAIKVNYKGDTTFSPRALPPLTQVVE